MCTFRNIWSAKKNADAPGRNAKFYMLTNLPAFRIFKIKSVAKRGVCCLVIFVNKNFHLIWDYVTCQVYSSSTRRTILRIKIYPPRWGGIISTWEPSGITALRTHILLPINPDQRQTSGENHVLTAFYGRSMFLHVSGDILGNNPFMETDMCVVYSQQTAVLLRLPSIHVFQISRPCSMCVFEGAHVCTAPRITKILARTDFCHVRQIYSVCTKAHRLFFMCRQPHMVTMCEMLSAQIEDL